MRKPFRRLIVAVIIAIVIAGLGYLALAIYYRGGFIANTWINGIYCTGSSVQEVNEQLLNQTVMPKTLTVIGYDRTGEDCEAVEWTISMEDLNYSIDYTAALNSYVSKQNVWLWMSNLTLQQKRVIEPRIVYDEVALLEAMQQITAYADAQEEYRIEYSEDSGYVLHDGMHNRVDSRKVADAIQNAITNRQESVNLIESGCYYDVALNEEQLENQALWFIIDAFQNQGPYYDFGDGAERVDAAYMAKFVSKSSLNNMPFVSEDGHLYLSGESPSEWIAEAADRTDTYGKIWEFTSSRGEVVNVEGKTYGTVINRERETVWLEAYLKELIDGKSADDTGGEGSKDNPRIPEYSKTAYQSGNELGDTYIEVDMGFQKLYYYQNGKLMLETDVVSGNMRRGWDTPEGVNYVYNKQKNRILRGEGYATPVDYWMPVNGSIGIHDADWRSEFGGEIYLTNGSHGCINVPKEVMPELYEMVEIGTPVIMFYGSDPNASN